MLLAEIIVTGYLGYKRIAWWLPAVIALAFVIFGASEFNSAPAAWRMRFTVTDLLWNLIASVRGIRDWDVDRQDDRSRQVEAAVSVTPERTTTVSCIGEVMRAIRKSVRRLALTIALLFAVPGVLALAAATSVQFGWNGAIAFICRI